MSKKSLMLLGAGGHCVSCIDVIETAGQWNIGGILDKTFNPNSSVLGYPVVGTDMDIEKYVQAGYSFFITVGQIKSSAVRKALFELVLLQGGETEVVVSPKAHVSNHSEIGIGTIVHHFASVNSNTVLGQNCIINTFANIEHEVEIGHHTHISTGVIVNGGAVIGSSCFVGSGSVIANDVSIADNVVIGAGSVVLSDIKEPGIYVGSPCRTVLK